MHEMTVRQIAAIYLKSELVLSFVFTFLDFVPLTVPMMMRMSSIASFLLIASREYNRNTTESTANIIKGISTVKAVWKPPVASPYPMFAMRRAIVAWNPTLPGIVCIVAA